MCISTPPHHHDTARTKTTESLGYTEIGPFTHHVYRSHNHVEAYYMCSLLYQFQNHGVLGCEDAEITPCCLGMWIQDWSRFWISPNETSDDKTCLCRDLHAIDRFLDKARLANFSSRPFQDSIIVFLTDSENDHNYKTHVYLFGENVLQEGKIKPTGLDHNYDAISQHDKMGAFKL